MIDNCKKCGKNRLIVNRKYHLCNYCNGIRLNAQSNTNTLKVEDNSTSKSKRGKKSKIRLVSKKESANQKELKKVYEEIDQTRDHICEGCGQNNKLSHSHLISQSNKEFQCDPSNIVYHCLERKVADEFGNKGCHARWESKQLKQVKTLNNYLDHLAYLKENDNKTYIKIAMG